MNILIAVTEEESERPDITEARRGAMRVADAVRALGGHAEIFGVMKNMVADPSMLGEMLHATDADCVFNLFEGFGDDAAAEAVFVRILEHAGLRYTGNRSGTLEACLDKAHAKERLHAAGVPTAWSVAIRSAADIDALDLAVVPFPVFVKACAEDASIGIDVTSKVDRAEDLKEVLRRKLAALPGGILAEEFLPGREFNVGMLGVAPYERLGVGVIDYSLHPDCEPFLTYDAKWNPRDRAYHDIVPDVSAVLCDELLDRLTSIARAAGEALHCSGYFRVDMREKDGGLFVMDVNPNPDIDEDAGFMRQARARGWSFEDMIGKLIAL